MGELRNQGLSILRAYRGPAGNPHQKIADALVAIGLILADEPDPVIAVAPEDWSPDRVVHGGHTVTGVPMVQDTTGAWHGVEIMGINPVADRSMIRVEIDGVRYVAVPQEGRTD